MPKWAKTSRYNLTVDIHLLGEVRWPQVIKTVRISQVAKKQLRKVPAQVVKKFRTWVISVESEGLEKVREIPGYHDEPLRGRRKGQRSIRLNRAYRAIYKITKEGALELVNVEEVNKHDY